MRTGGGGKDDDDDDRPKVIDDDDDDEEEDDDGYTPQEREARAKDPFGFRTLKENYKDGSLPYPNVTEEELAAIEETLETKGKYRLGPNIFGLESIPKEMADAWEEVSESVGCRREICRTETSYIHTGSPSSTIT